MRVLVFCVLFALLSEFCSSAEKPNILLVMTDDQGWWDVGMRGNKDIDTPNLDRLSQQGVDFTRYYAAPVCSLTRAGLMTGRYYLRTGLYNTRFGGDTISLKEITVAQLLQKAGYRTGCFGKWHLGKYAPYQPQNRGFDEFFGHYHGHIEEYDFPDQVFHNGRPVEGRKYVTDLFTDTAIEFIQEQTDQPWFCYLPMNAPHSPWVVGTSHFGQQRGDVLIEKYLKRGLVLREARIYAMIEIIDDNIGRLMAKLDELKVADNTIVIFTTDNGGVSKHYKAGLKSNKASIYEGGVRVPLFVRWPGQFPAGGKVNAQCSHVDWFPTLCEIAGADVPNDRPIDGKSLLPLLNAGKGETHHQYVYHTWDRYHPNSERRWSISDQRWKLACQVGTGKQATQSNWQLYDLQSDIGETKNLKGKHPEVVQRLRNEFVRWFADVTENMVYQPVPIPVGHADEPLIEIQASWATVDGKNTRYEFSGYDWDTIEGWKALGDTATWDLDVQQDGQYAISVRYGRSNQSTGSIQLSVGDQSLVLNPPPTPSADVFEKTRIGTINLKRGKLPLKASVKVASDSEVLRLNSIYLEKI